MLKKKKKKLERRGRIFPSLPLPSPASRVQPPAGVCADGRMEPYKYTIQVNIVIFEDLYWVPIPTVLDTPPIRVQVQVCLAHAGGGPLPLLNLLPHYSYQGTTSPISTFVALSQFVSSRITWPPQSPHLSNVLTGTATCTYSVAFMFSSFHPFNLINVHCSSFPIK